MPFNVPKEELEALYTKKHKSLTERFEGCKTPQQTYEKIIELGRQLPNSKEDIQKECFLVAGCQSTVYLSSDLSGDGRITYHVRSDALISSGLAALLLAVYDKEPLELILYYPPLFIQELGLHQSLSPGRSNGLSGMYSRMKKDAIKFFIDASKEV